ncbi:MAG: glutathione S-transferase family protein [Gammaproteobacteria bacterium]|nr:glutathione S-transferase family protein [Gammaproteobacteria bacterium]MDE2251125.1 glutathione S-transferase family protein [Gammaproteobacteria bacterium]
MYTLYYSPGAASLAVHLALLEIGAPHRLELVDFDRAAQHSPEYLRVNPQGKVPTLLVDGQACAEVAALLMILADRHPQARLAPPVGSAQRNEWYQWLAYFAYELGATFRGWFYPQNLGYAQHPPELRAALGARIGAVWDRVDAQLSAGGPYLLGAQLSMADLQLLMYMRWSRNMPRPALAWPALAQFAGHMRARASWQRLCELEGLTEWRG